MREGPGRPRRPPAALVLLILAALSAPSIAAAPMEENPISPALFPESGVSSAGIVDARPSIGSEDSSRADSPPEGPFARFMREHGWRLTFSLGISEAARIYYDNVGYSRDPLFFGHTPGFDKAIRGTLDNPNTYNGFIDNYSLLSLKVAGALSIIGLDAGNGHEMADDLFGFVDAIYTNKGATSLLKDIVGRKRPKLQFADPETMGRKAYDALNATPHYHRSFPSGHASASFTMISYLERLVARKVGLRSAARKFTFLGLYAVSSYIGYTRIDQDEHFFSDVVAGAALGVWEGRTFYRLEHPEEFGDRGAARTARIRFYPPQILPGGAAMTIGVRLGSDRP